MYDILECMFEIWNAYANPKIDPCTVYTMIK